MRLWRFYTFSLLFSMVRSPSFEAVAYATAMQYSKLIPWQNAIAAQSWKSPAFLSRSQLYVTMKRCHLYVAKNAMNFLFLSI